MSKQLEGSFEKGEVEVLSRAVANTQGEIPTKGAALKHGAALTNEAEEPSGLKALNSVATSALAARGAAAGFGEIAKVSSRVHSSGPEGGI